MGFLFAFYYLAGGVEFFYDKKDKSELRVNGFSGLTGGSGVNGYSGSYGCSG